MMPEHLLSELEQTATEHGVKTALIMAFQQGKLESYREFMQDARQQARKTSESSNRTDVPEVEQAQKLAAVSVEQAGSKPLSHCTLCVLAGKSWEDSRDRCYHDQAFADAAKPKFTSRVYDRDWVSQEGD